MTKIILATLLAIGFNAFANEHEGTATETMTPPAAEGTTGADTKMEKKDMAHKGKAMGKHTAKGKGAAKKDEKTN